MRTRQWMRVLRDRDDGSVTGYNVIITLAVLAFAGLVLDGGLAVATKVDAVSAAQASARAGARELDVAYLRTSGVIRLDETKARNTARQWLASTGLSGTVTVTGNTVTVSVTTFRNTQLLQLVGIGSIPIGATATATAVRP